LDQEVANLVLTLPLQARLGFGQGKLVLAEAMRNSLPRHISLSRKQPFHLPINDWLRCEWRPLVQDVLLDKRTRDRGWVDHGEIHRLIKEHLTGRALHGRRLYQLLILELWARAILDRGEADSHPSSVADCARELDPNRPLRQVAVIAPAGIGDTLCLTPGLRQLGQTDPNVSVTLYVDQGRGADQVMAGSSPVERQVPINFSDRGLAKVFQLLGDIRRNPPDLLVSTLISRFSWLVGALAGVKDRRSWVPQWSLTRGLDGLVWRQPQPYNPQQRDVGRQDSLAFCELLGVPVMNPLKPYIAPPLWEESCLARTRVKLKGLSRPILAVNAVAQPDIPQRQYPLGRLSQALGELLHRGTINTVALLGDSYSRACHGPLHASLGPRGLDLSGELSLGATAAVLRECDAVLTIDGGLLHVALTTGLPVVALYGPTEIFSTDPRGLSGRYTALSAFDCCRCECLNHRGIKVRSECREEARCLASLSPGQIVAAVAALLGEAGTADAGGGKTP
jgi:ADP-heptose:LPS heptosyltransferase